MLGSWGWLSADTILSNEVGHIYEKARQTPSSKKPFENDNRCRSAKQLRNDEAQGILRADAGERIGGSAAPA
jgi:hypothetical protein